MPGAPLGCPVSHLATSTTFSSSSSSSSLFAVSPECKEIAAYFFGVLWLRGRVCYDRRDVT
ncbi:hypothetical protein E2C01_100049 [Portunus trituberculatus]|uniref:Uncharacterized protein n=1 Tax=Portunus trituberculatus TaxID=210409 RepID=A0A5B7KBZ0_PORTR|nr:hypothetical protein [Portunus trituberculatus]